MKHCTKCGQDKPIKAFALNSTRKDGLQCWCRACTRSQEALYGSRRPSRRTPHKSPSRTTGRPPRPARDRVLCDGNGGDVIRDLLRNTVWPQTMIADLAQCSTATVSRILHADETLPKPRPAYTARSIRRSPNLHLTKRLWVQLLVLRQQMGPLSALTIARCAFKLRRVGSRDRTSTTAERLKRLKSGRSTRNMDTRTKVNEDLLLKLLPYMLIHHAMYGVLLPHPKLVGVDANLEWLPEPTRTAVAQALGQEEKP